MLRDGSKSVIRRMAQFWGYALTNWENPSGLAHRLYCWGSGLPKDIPWECEHDWCYHDDRATARYTGYLERCSKCGQLQQVPQ